MPGRPKTKMKKVAALEDMSIELLTELFLVVPKQWLEADEELRAGKRPDIRDETGKLWLTALVFTRQTVSAFENLGNAMRRKAGDTGPSMLKDFADGMFVAHDGHAVECNETASVDCDGAGDGQRGER